MHQHPRASLALMGLFALLLSGCSVLNPGINLAPTPTADTGGGPVQVIATVTRPVGLPVTVTVASAQRGAIASSLVYNGHVQAEQQAQVAPKVTGRIETFAVDVGGVVKAGDVLATIGATNQAGDILKAQAAYDAAVAHLATMKAGPRADSLVAAQAGVDTAKAKLAALQRGPLPETVAQAHDIVVSAQAKLHAMTQSRPEALAVAKDALDQAKAKLDLFLAGPTADQITAAQTVVEQAKNSLLAAQSQRDGLCNPANPKYQCDGAQATVNAATNAADSARLQLTILTSPPTPAAVDQAHEDEAAAEQQYNLALHPYTADDLAQATAAVDAAQQQYDLARSPATQADLDEAQSAIAVAEAQQRLAQTPYTDDDIKLAETAVTLAKVDLDTASAANVVAPFGGIVGQRLLDVGAETGPDKPLVTLVSQAVKISANVDESKLSFLTIGQEARITVPAYPDVAFNAKVESIPQIIDPQARTGEIRLNVTDDSNQLKPGMFAVVSLLSAQRPNALLVPQSALDTVNGQSVVYLVVNNTIQVKPVTVGLSNDQSVEITTGLSEGQVVVAGDKPALTDGQHVTVDLLPG